MNTQYILIALVILCLSLYHFRMMPEKIKYSLNTDEEKEQEQDEEQDEDSSQIKDNFLETFQNILPKNDCKIILLYSKNCSHSIDFIPTWEKLKTLKVSNTKFVEIEASEDIDDSFAKYNIKTVPKLILHFDHETDFSVYKGDRSLESILEFLKLKGINLNESYLEGFQNERPERRNIRASIGFDKDRNEYYLKTPKLKTYINKHNDKVHPLFSIILTYIDELKVMGLTPKQITEELNVHKIKKFLIDCEHGICCQLDKVKSIYKDDSVNMEVVKNLEENVCKKNMAYI